MSIQIADEAHLKLSSIFALVLIIIKADRDLDTHELTNDHILSYIFPDEPSTDTDLFEDKLNQVFGEMKNTALINNIAVPLLTHVLKDYVLLNNLFSIIFIFTKDILPHQYEDKTKKFKGYSLSSEKLFKFDIHKNSIFGKFIHSAYLTYSKDSIKQQKYNSVHLKEVQKIYGQSHVNTLLDYQSQSLIAKMVLSGDNIDTFLEFKHEYLNDNEGLPIYLKDMMNLDDITATSLEENTMLSNNNVQYVKDYFFSRLDTCSSQYEILNLVNVLICHEKYGKEIKFILEITSTIMEANKFEEDTEFYTMMFVLMYISLSLDPSLKDSGIISRNVMEKMKGIDQELEGATFENSGLSLPIYINFLLAKVRYSTYEGNFSHAYETLTLATRLKLVNQTGASKLSSKSTEVNHGEPILYQDIKQDFYTSMGFANYENNLEKDAYYKQYKDIQGLAKQGNCGLALHEIDRIIDTMNKNNYIWMFEFKLLKCLICGDNFMQKYIYSKALV